VTQHCSISGRLKATVFRRRLTTLIYGHCLPAAGDAMSKRILDCFTDVASWMTSNRRQLNSKKTDSFCGAETRAAAMKPPPPDVFFPRRRQSCLCDYNWPLPVMFV